MVGKQFFNNFVEILVPKLVTFWKRYIYRKNIEDGEEKTLYTRWEQDYNLQHVDRLDLIDEYLEMVIQYGFVTLFVAAFPLAPFFALINNIIEIRVDAYKYVTTLRRPLAQRVQDIGAWANILQTITYLSVFTNGVVIAVTSDFIPRLVYKTTASFDDSWAGYVNWTLSRFEVSHWLNATDGDTESPQYLGPSNETLEGMSLKENITHCYFKAFRNTENVADGYPLKVEFYHIWIARLAFVIIFQNVVMGLTGLFAVLVPDVPNGVKVQIQREKLLAREVLFDAEINDTVGNYTQSAHHSAHTNSDTTATRNVFSPDVEEVRSRKSVNDEDLDSIEATIRNYD